MQTLILTEEQIQADKKHRLEEFQKEYKELIKKHQIDIGANVQPVLKFVDLKEYQKQE